MKEWVRRSRDRKKTLLEQIRNESSYASSTTDGDTDGTLSPMLLAIPFPKRGEASRKRKRRSDNRLYKKIRKLENEKKNLKSIRSVISGKKCQKYKLIRYAATKTNTDRRKLSKVKEQGDKPHKIKTRIRTKALRSRD